MTWLHTDPHLLAGADIEGSLGIVNPLLCDSIMALLGLYQQSFPSLIRIDNYLLFLQNSRSAPVLVQATESTFHGSESSSWW